MSAGIGADALRAALQGGEEIALLDVREEAAFGPEHILLAVHLPLSRLELRAAWLVPRRNTRIVLCDGAGEELAERAAGILEGHGYSRVAVLDGASGPGEARLEVARRYRLEPGHAGLYDVGAIHSIAYGDDARFVRVTGADLEHVPRLKFDLEQGTAVLVESASMQRTPA